MSNSTRPAPALWPAPHPSGPVRATVRLPGSKSLTNRALVLAALSDGPSVVRRALRSRDTQLMAEALAQLGPRRHHRRRLEGHARVPCEGRETIDCGLAGTVMRFVPPVAALADGPVVFDGDPHARLRPMHEVLEGLRGLGVAVEDEDRGSLPFTVARHRPGARRRGHHRRVGLQPVRLRAAAGRAPLRRGRRRPPRRQAGAVPAAHRDDASSSCGCTASRSTTSEPNRWRVRPAAGARGRRRGGARPVQRGAVPGRGAGHRRPGHGAGLAAQHHPGRRRAARDRHPDGRQRRADRRGPDRDRHRHAARHRLRPARRRRAHPGGGGAVPAGLDPVAPARDRPHPGPRDRPDRRAGHRVQRPGRPRHRDRGRARPSGRGRWTADRSAPTPTTGWRTPG